MMEPNGEQGPAMPGPVFFPIAFHEVSILYSVLFEREKCLPSREEMEDEIARRELYPTTRHVTAKAMDALEEVQAAMREYLVNFAGEAAVLDLEARVVKTISQHREKKR